MNFTIVSRCLNVVIMLDISRICRLLVFRIFLKAPRPFLHLNLRRVCKEERLTNYL